MDAQPVDSPEKRRLRRDARKALLKLGFDEAALQRATTALEPRFSHKMQIEKLVGRLGLSPDGDVATMWIELNKTYGRAHERSFNERLEVDEAFRAQYVRRFDTVIRALTMQLQGRYAALMRRAKQIAGMRPEKGIKLFVSEIPSAPQLHNYFYENLQSNDWLPFLEKEGLLSEPLSEVRSEDGLPIWEWPVGRYLARMASSDDASTRKIVQRALRALATSAHPDVQRLALDAVAALPSDEAATLVDVVPGWLTSDTAHFLAAPHKIISRLAEAGNAEAAITVFESVFRVFQREGELTAFFDSTMYEHYVKDAVSHLAKADVLTAIPLVSDLLLRASRMDRRLSAVKEEDYSYYTVGSLWPDQMGGGDILATLIRAIVTLATSAVKANPANVRRILNIFEGYKPKIFRQISMYVLALAPGQAADTADRYLTDVALIDADWCREEYAALANAWLNDLPPDRQKLIFDFIDSVPAAFLDTWRTRFEQQEGRAPTAEDDRRFREITIRDIVWEWRHNLPPDRRIAIEKTAIEFGDPNAWRDRYVARDQSPLSRTSIQSQTVDDTVRYLEMWRPDPQLQSHTAVGLANELREAVSTKPEAFSAAATKFSGVRPLFIRNLLDGLRQSTVNDAEIDWTECISLIRCILERSEAPIERSNFVPGDDSDWSLAVQSGIEWLASGLRRGAGGVPFVFADTIQRLVFDLYYRAARLAANGQSDPTERNHPYFRAVQTARGAAIELCVWLLFWESKNPAGRIGKAPRDALSHAPEVRAIFEAELQDTTQSGWISRAIASK